MLRHLSAWVAVLALTLSLAACSGGSSSLPSPDASPSGSGSVSPDEHALVLADGDSTLDGQPLGESGPVTLTHDILYYEDRDTYDSGSPYGEGTADERHTAEEAQAHTVITIQEAGVYRVSGSLNPGQLAIDLGEGARTSPDACVTLILDGADITCTVAPAVLFYQVYECDQDYLAWLEHSRDSDEAEPYDAPTDVDTSHAGARVILADSSSNRITGSHVARIYEDGTTDRLAKYDGAFYSTSSLQIDGEEEGTGVLTILADNEGLDSELHLTINGGYLNIQAQNDGINTNEDGVSVTTINGGTLQLNAGLGEEGDAIDSNGHLVIRGGNVFACASDHSPDGGLDADGEILLHGGFVVATGIRNDAVSDRSSQPFLELSFAATLPSGTQVDLNDAQGNSLLSFPTRKACQSIVFSSPDLKQDTPYTLLLDGVQQQYTGNRSVGFQGAPSAPPEGQPPEGSGQEPAGQPPQLPEEASGQPPQPPEGASGQPPQPPEGESGQPPQPPEGASGQRPPLSEATDTPASSEFVLTDRIHTFSGISASPEASGRTQVTFSADLTVGEDGTVSLRGITASQDVDPSHVQITVTDVPSENCAASCLWSDGEEAIAALLPQDPGTYLLTIAVTQDPAFTGSTSFPFILPTP